MNGMGGADSGTGNATPSALWSGLQGPLSSAKVLPNVPCVCDGEVRAMGRFDRRISQRNITQSAATRRRLPSRSTRPDPSRIPVLPLRHRHACVNPSSLTLAVPATAPQPAPSNDWSLPPPLLQSQCRRRILTSLDSAYSDVTGPISAYA